MLKLKCNVAHSRATVPLICCRASPAITGSSVLYKFCISLHNLTVVKLVKNKQIRSLYSNNKTSYKSTALQTKKSGNLFFGSWQWLVRGLTNVLVWWQVLLLGQNLLNTWINRDSRWRFSTIHPEKSKNGRKKTVKGKNGVYADLGGRCKCDQDRYRSKIFKHYGIYVLYYGFLFVSKH